MIDAKRRHTAEPWIARALSSGAIEIVSVREEHIYEVIAYPTSEIYGSSTRQGSKEENARRIVACVNACAGITMYEFEGLPYLDIKNGVAGLLSERDKLLDALCRALPYVEDAEKDPVFKPGVVKKLATELRAIVEEVEAP
jgi:hypothetical protein